MNRKNFLKSIAGLVGLTAVAPAVLLARPVSAIYLPIHMEYYPPPYLWEKYYTRGFWQQIEVGDIKSYEYKPIDFEEFLLYD